MTSHLIRLQDSFIINISQNNQSNLDFLLSTERKPLRLLLLVGYVQACPANIELNETCNGILGHLMGSMQIKYSSK